MVCILEVFGFIREGVGDRGEGRWGIDLGGESSYWYCGV